MELEVLSSGLIAYGVRPCAVVGFFVLVVFLWTFPLRHFFAYLLLFLFLGAVMGSAWFGGRIAGVVSVLLSRDIRERLHRGDW